MDLNVTDETTPYIAGLENPTFRSNLSLGVKIMTFIISVPVIIGNTSTIIIILRYRWLRSKTNALIFSLCCVDLGVGIFTVLTYTVEWWNIFTAGLWYSSVLHLLVIAIERYVAIIYPLRYHSLITKRVIGLLVAFAWFFAILTSSIPFLILNHLNISDMKSIHILGFVLYMLEGIAVILLYIKILLVVYTQMKQIQCLSLEQKKTSKSEIKATKMIGLIILAYFLTWVPVSFLNILEISGTFSYQTKSTPVYLSLKSAFLLMGFCNSGVNFFIYGAKYTLFRKAYYSLYTCKSLHDHSVQK